MKKLTLFLAILISCTQLQAQVQPKGILKGKILSVNSGEPIAYVQVFVSKDTSNLIRTTSNWDGSYHFNDLDSGFWNVGFLAQGYEYKELKQIKILESKAIVLNITLSIGNGIHGSTGVRPDYLQPIMVSDKTANTGYSVTHVQQMAVRSVADITKVAGNGIISRDNGSGQNNVRGQRSASSVTFIDGVKVIGSTSLPKSAIEEVSVQTGGVSAQYENASAPGVSEVRIFNTTSRSSARKVRAVKPVPVEIYAEPVEQVMYFENELYQEIADNEFESPKQTPLSTFSIDVDKASYANTRRFLNEGMLPPSNAVRIEELINYFNYDYPQPEGEHPFSITTELTTCPWNENRQLALIGIQGETIDMEQAPKSNLVFLLDVSGSMGSPNKLGLLKKGLTMLIEQLREEDRIAIVVYAGAAGVVLKSTSGNKKHEIKRVLNRLSAGGSTAGGAGIKLAYKIAEDNFIKGGNNRILLATDGDFNVGTSSQEALVKLIEKKREGGVFLSVLGFGDGNLQDYKMEQIADKGNGNYSYIDNILEAKKVLVSEMGGTLFTIAKDVKVQAEFNPAKVKAYRLIGYVNRALAAEDFNDDTKDAGELGAGHTVTVLYEIVPVGSEEKIKDIDELKYQKEKDIDSLSDELLTVKFRYKQPDGEKSILLTKTMKDEVIELENASHNLQFSAAVASFGMKLRQSTSVNDLDFKDILEIAKMAKGLDENGYRAEFLRLVETAELIK